VVGSSSAAEIETALNGVDPRGQSAVWDGMVLAGNLLKDDGPLSEKVVILFSAAPTGLNSATPARAESALRQAGAQLDAVVMQRGADVAAISDMISVLGGAQVEAPTED